MVGAKIGYSQGKSRIAVSVARTLVRAIWQRTISNACKEAEIHDDAPRDLIEVYRNELALTHVRATDTSEKSGIIRTTFHDPRRNYHI